MSMKPKKRSRLERDRHARKMMMLAFVTVLIVGAFVQIAMIARLAGQNKAMRNTENEIRELSATADNLNLSLSQYRSLDRVAAQAERLGMEKPTQAQIRVVNLPDIVEDTSAQSAGTGAGAMNP